MAEMLLRAGADPDVEDNDIAQITPRALLSQARSRTRDDDDGRAIAAALDY
eukprot:gene32456-29907_t